MEKKYLLIVLIITASFIGCKGIRKLTNSRAPEATIPQYYQPQSQRLSWILPNLANGCNHIDSLVTYYDSANYIINEFQLKNQEGASIIGGSWDQFKKIWCFFADSVNGTKYTIDDYSLTESVPDIPGKNAIGIVLDHSGSIGDDRAVILQQAIIELVNNKKTEDGFFIEKFDHRVNTEVPFTNDKKAILDKFKISGLQNYGGATSINNALDVAISNLDAISNYDNKFIILFTDGMDNKSSVAIDDVIRKAKEKNIRIFSIAFGADINSDYLKVISDPTKGKNYHIYQTVEFTNIFDDIYNQFIIKQHRYILKYKPKVFFGVHHLLMKICLGECPVTKTTIPVEPLIYDNVTLNINFDYEKSDIKDSVSFEEIRLVADYLIRHSEIKIVLEGHTDCRGTRDFNLKLSASRAESVKKALVAKGINPNRIITKGYGFDKPYIVTKNDNIKHNILKTGISLDCELIKSLDSDDDKEVAHSLNRRTQMVIVK